MITRHQIIDEAKTWLGTPWHHQGRQKGVGVDCIGLIGCVAVALRIPGSNEWEANSKYHRYDRRPSSDLLLEGVGKYLTRVAAGLETIDKRSPGDILVMRFHSLPQHLAILVDRNNIIHAYAQARKVVLSPLNGMWGQMVVGTYTYSGVE